MAHALILRTSLAGFVLLWVVSCSCEEQRGVHDIGAGDVHGGELGDVSIQDEVWQPPIHAIQPYAWGGGRSALGFAPSGNSHLLVVDYYSTARRYRYHGNYLVDVVDLTHLTESLCETEKCEMYGPNFRNVAMTTDAMNRDHIVLTPTEGPAIFMTNLYGDWTVEAFPGLYAIDSDELVIYEGTDDSSPLWIDRLSDLFITPDGDMHLLVSKELYPIGENSTTIFHWRRSCREVMEALE